jgi:mannose-6-phosphate isomerase-like protein (cupin superfamily)
MAYPPPHEVGGAGVMRYSLEVVGGGPFLDRGRFRPTPSTTRVDPSASTAGGAPGWEPLDPSLLLATQAHGGLGEIRFRRLWEHDRFATGWGFVDHTVVDPGTSVGYHRHEAVQECYLILAGTGVMKLDDESFDVEPGVCIPNHLGGAHGIVAPAAPVEFINVALYTEGRFDATDLGDDLADCLR